MAAGFVVAIVLSSRPWSVRLHSFVADHVTDIDVRVVRDRRAAFDASPDVLVVDDSIPWLTSTFVNEAADAQIRLVGLYDRTNPSARERLVDLGLTHLFEESMPAEDAVFLIDRLRPADVAVPDRTIASASTVPANGRGGALAIGGASGSGAREIALGLAAALGSRGSTLLVDCNETTPGVSRRLGLGPFPHVVTAVDRYRAEGLPGIDASLADQTHRLPFDVVVGLPTPRDWDRLVAHDAAALLEGCRDGWQHTVVTTSPLIEDLQRWGDRFGVSRRLIESADVVVGVVEPTPRGTLRYLDWLSEAARLTDRVVTVVNKLPRTERVLRQVVRELTEVAGSLVADVHAVPFDRRVMSAEWDGTLVSRGSFTKAIAALAATLDHSEQRLLTEVGT